VSSGIELVIFDCDGVLVDTERLAVRVDVQVLAQLGWVITEAEVVEHLQRISNDDLKAMLALARMQRIDAKLVNLLGLSGFGKELCEISGHHRTVR